MYLYNKRCIFAKNLVINSLKFYIMTSYRNIQIKVDDNNYLLLDNCLVGIIEENGVNVLLVRADVCPENLSGLLKYGFAFHVVAGRYDLKFTCNSLTSAC